jgi:hypothetical protein
MTNIIRATTIPIDKWMQVHEGIRLIQVFSHEVNYNPRGIIALNKRIESVGGHGLKLNSANTLVTIGWMIIARAYELIDENLSGTDLQQFYTSLVKETKNHCQITSFDALKSRYRLHVDTLHGSENSQYEQSLWKLVKALRDAISHIDYRFDFSSGNAADKALIKIEHSYKSVLKLKMSSSVSDFFLFAEHLGVWIDSALQKNGFLR